MDTSRFVADHVAGLSFSGIREFFSIVAKMPQAISLGVGEPDFVTPWHIREAAIFALERGKTSYTDNFGLIALRREISKYVAELVDTEYNPESEILVTTGVSEAMDIAFRAILNPGDKVLYHEPCYVAYLPSVLLAHGKAVPVATKAEDNFALDPDALIAAWEPGVKALLLNFPTNPTGGTLSGEAIAKIATFAEEKDLLIISDEIYSELTFEGRHETILREPGMRDRTIFCHGFSKAFAMTGFRIGYVCAPKPLVEAMMKVHQYAMMCAPILSQEAATEALRNGEHAVASMREQYRKRRDFIVRQFNEVGLPCHLPKGSFYAFPDISATGLDDMTFAKELLKAEEVAVVPGSAFGPSGTGHVRACFATSYEQLIEAGKRIARFVDERGVAKAG